MRGWFSMSIMKYMLICHTVEVDSVKMLLHLRNFLRKIQSMIGIEPVMMSSHKFRWAFEKFAES